ncbi:type II toxin-antitoxin system VapC family toxin [Rhodoferax sp.]|uniref:type II toxin-antitoxin system VapC family toxin n=1 Tax=Rhodoferax sp. TaxID=50421 RepID=UPI00261DDA07|nr:type II toxin-antitoxin system VapC family toxin [Rhodoferax sp.]MDD2810216.1 type II toxin-antitoxin system VapC family toxin [Rhodoferax sp.]MDD4944196.1 type II toxin-antitoxin system VapC family toxin [Rhodoferax sp.]
MPLTVILELEWVLRAFYGFTPADFARVVQHLLGLPQAKVAQGALVLDALQSHTQGLDFADALHLHASSHCTEFISFDDKKFARRAMQLGLTPHVTVPI